MESDYKEISQVELPKSIMAETMGDAILNYYEIPFFPDRFEDEGFDWVRIHSVNQKTKARVDTAHRESSI